MKATNRRVAAQSVPKIRFDVRPALSRAYQETELEHLKNRLLRESLDASGETELNTRLRSVAHEAAAMAWTTNIPLLVFPALLEEKIRKALLQADRQELIRERSRKLLAA